MKMDFVWDDDSYIKHSSEVGKEDFIHNSDQI